MQMQALLINGQGYYGDCQAIGGLGDVAGEAPEQTTCNVTDYSIPGGELQMPSKRERAETFQYGA